MFRDDRSREQSKAVASSVCARMKFAARHFERDIRLPAVEMSTTSCNLEAAFDASEGHAAVRDIGGCVPVERHGGE